MQHGLRCFERLLAVLLGPAAVAPKKSAFGCILEVLGVEVQCSEVGIKCQPDQSKRAGWADELTGVLQAKNCVTRVGEQNR
eukprot:1839248-Karenia_brevis.AAC.1